MKPGKRIFDIVVTLIGCIVLIPLMVVISIFVFIFMGSPIFYLQQRTGYKGKPFTLYKFRTMNDRRNEKGTLLSDAERLTTFGRLLRSTSLDDLPQFINVLRGDMSLVGPRPLFTKYLDLYSPKQMHRHDILPGITGWAQINGRNALSWEEKFRLDVWYVDHWSFWLDLKILFLTPLKVLRREGINQPGHATAEEFKGSGK
jgi:sugar transferase EpsL